VPQQFTFLNSFDSLSPTISTMQDSPFIVPTETPAIYRESVYIKALKILREGKLSPVDLFLYALNEDIPSNFRYRQGLYWDGGKFNEVLDTLKNSCDGSTRLKRWFIDSRLDLLHEIIDDEMDSVKKRCTMPLDDISPQYIDNWSFETHVGAVAINEAPTLFKILLRAAQTQLAAVKNKIKKPDTVSQI
jgi:hypothetical protein